MIALVTFALGFAAAIGFVALCSERLAVDAGAVLSLVMSILIGMAAASTLVHRASIVPRSAPWLTSRSSESCPPLPLDYDRDLDPGPILWIPRVGTGRSLSSETGDVL